MDRGVDVWETEDVADGEAEDRAKRSAAMGIGIVVGVAPDIGVGEVLGSLVLLLEVQVQGLALPVLPMLIH